MAFQTIKSAVSLVYMYGCYDSVKHTYNNSDNSDDEEIEVHNPTELLHQVFRQEHEQRILGCLDLVVLLLAALVHRSHFYQTSLGRR